MIYSTDPDSQAEIDRIIREEAEARKREQAELEERRAALEAEWRKLEEEERKEEQARKSFRL